MQRLASHCPDACSLALLAHLQALSAAAAAAAASDSGSTDHSATNSLQGTPPAKRQASVPAAESLPKIAELPQLPAQALALPMTAAAAAYVTAAMTAAAAPAAGQ